MGVNRISTKPKICLVSDVRGWAFDQNNRDLAEHLSDRFDFEHFYVVDWIAGERPDWGKYDAIFELYHRNPGMNLPYERTAGALRSEWFDPDHAGSPTAKDVNTVNRYAVFQVAVQRNYSELSSRCPRVVYLTNPVNMRRFSTVTPVRDRIVAEWNGNALHKAGNSYIKHFRDVVIPACQSAGVPLMAAEYNTRAGDWRRREPAEMPAFYRQASVALCASEFEAASNSVLEAMASGLAVVATDCGNHREMRDSQVKEFGDTGILLTAGTVDAFTKALRELTPKRAAEMGRINRAEIEARWSWSAWRDRYAAFLTRALRPSAKGAGASPKLSAPKLVTPLRAVGVPAVDFSYWNKVDPSTFLADDWDNVSRAWVGRAVSAAVKRGCATMAEAGPGVGVDYERQVKAHVVAGRLRYSGYEGSSGLCAHLAKKFPEATWCNKPLTDMAAREHDIVYSRAVLEHQPALEPSLSRLLDAARKLVVIVWYRPPAAVAVSEKAEGVYYQTFKKSEVLDVVRRAGWVVVEETQFKGGNEGWLLEPDEPRVLAPDAGPRAA